MEKAKIISVATGEIIGSLEEGDRIIKGNTTEYLERTEEWKIENFYKGNID